MSAIGPLVPPPEGSGEMAPAPLPPADEPPARHRHRPAVRFTQRHLLGIRAVLNLLLLLALLYTVTLARDLLIPLVLAGFIGLAFNPIVAFAARRRVPRWLSASFLVIALIAGILGFGGIAGASIEIAKAIFFIAIILFLVSAVVGLVRGRGNV